MTRSHDNASVRRVNECQLVPSMSNGDSQLPVGKQTELTCSSILAMIILNSISDDMMRGLWPSRIDKDIESSRVNKKVARQPSRHRRPRNVALTFESLIGDHHTGVLGSTHIIVLHFHTDLVDGSKARSSVRRGNRKKIQQVKGRMSERLEKMANWGGRNTPGLLIGIRGKERTRDKLAVGFRRKTTTRARYN
ncbi:hypothetical protein KQX54_010469 [Cotesia glomerata]|uniref:Uncharacterized protein n=1 Tax=Cotesia glomerata TaxID=32391 RepID=A0AAV7J7N4_COTGL|nr:hypothetical protein KQX54_010469 [Cotesia glomerata]